MTEPTAHAVEAPQVFYEEGARAGQVAAGSTKVGWTLRNAKGEITAAFAFLLNPQGITRTDGSRAQLFATQGGFYADDFGPAPTSIQIRQLVASGKIAPDGAYYVAVEDVQRFLKRIWLPATAGPGHADYSVYFHDHHFERGLEQRVLFPANSLTIARDVTQHGLVSIDLQMVGLEKYPYAEVEATKTKPTVGKPYRVRAGDTLHKLIVRLAGKKATPKRLKAVRAKLLALNPQITKPRVLSDGSPAKPLRIYPGELLTLPA